MSIFNNLIKLYTNGYNIIINTKMQTIPYNKPSTSRYIELRLDKSVNTLSDTFLLNIILHNTPTTK